MSEKPTSATSRFLPIDLGGLAVCLILTGLVYFVGIRPLIDQRAEAAEARDRLQEHRQTELGLKAKRQKLMKRLAAVRAALPESTLELQSVRRLNQRLDSLIQLARQFGLAIDEVRPGGSVEGPHFRKTAIHLIAKGGYQSCVKFLSEAHVRFRDTSVTDFALEANPGDRDPIARCKIDLLWYTSLEGGKRGSDGATKGTDC